MSSNLTHALTNAQDFSQEGRASLESDAPDNVAMAQVMTAMASIRGALTDESFNPKTSAPMANPIAALVTRSDFVGWLDALDAAIAAGISSEGANEDLAYVYELADAIGTGCLTFTNG